MTFPLDDYTPHGYLDVHGHAARLSPKGVLRSRRVGFEWHFPAYSGGYGGRRAHYTMYVGLTGNLTDIRCPYHSSGLVRFEGVLDGIPLAVTCYAVGDDAWAMDLTADGSVDVPVLAEYQRVVAADGQWGESGLLAREADALVLQSFEDGDAFAVLGGEWTLPSPAVVVGRPGDLVTVAAEGRCPSDRRSTRLVIARGRTAPEAVARAQSSAMSAPEARGEREASDAAFWESAPQLLGDWPGHWRRGLVYDLETLRMMPKQPVGSYAHPWDAMQIQSPRFVLGETAMDALALSWAAPEAAAAMFAGAFADAPAPNLPCSREDGTFNMISAEGLACGTGPQWGYPFLVLERLMETSPGLALDTQKLADFLGFWWRERRRGHLAFACSWESGQDESPRFGDHPWGGGSPTWQLEPVDLVAAMLHAARTLRRLGGSSLLDLEEIEQECESRLEQMWVGGRYADLHDGVHTGVRDVMQLAPVALGVGEQHPDVLREAAGYGGDDLHWPMFVWTAVLARERLGDWTGSADLAAGVVDRIWTAWDRRDAAEGESLPGISCEYWPLGNRCGGEGYGWGAFGVELFLSHVLGLRRAGGSWTMRPRLPVRGRFGVRFGSEAQRQEVWLEPSDGVISVSWNGRRFRVEAGRSFTPEGP